jgi:periplasmic protein TonB
MRVLAVLGNRSLDVKGATLALSVSAHAAVALVAAHGDGGAVFAEGSRVELPAPELVTLENPRLDEAPNEPARTAPEQRRAPHKHPYPVAADHDVTPHDPSVPHIPLPVHAPAPEGVAAAAPAVVDGSEAAPVRFVMTVGRAANAPGGVVSASAGETESPGSGAPLAEESVDAPATLLAGSAPAYTREAESAGVEADVPLEIVVDDRGHVAAARALRHVGYGLDEVALRSIRNYRFEPARRAGHPVPVRMRWLMRFELR